MKVGRWVEVMVVRKDESSAAESVVSKAARMVVSMAVTLDDSLDDYRHKKRERESEIVKMKKKKMSGVIYKIFYFNFKSK